MANNCLVTKLKATVDNSSLKKIGEIVINVTNSIPPTDSSFPRIQISYANGDSAEMYVEGEGSLYVNGNNVGQHIQEGAYNNLAVMPSVGSFKIHVVDKYNIGSIQLRTDNLTDVCFTIDSDDVSYLQNLTKFGSGDKIEYNGSINFVKTWKNCSISDFSLINAFSTLEDIVRTISNNTFRVNIHGDGFTGDISAFVNHSVQLIDVSNTNVGGDVATFFDENDNLLVSNLVGIDRPNSNVILSDATKEKLTAHNVSYR